MNNLQHPLDVVLTVALVEASGCATAEETRSAEGHSPFALRRHAGSDQIAGQPRGLHLAELALDELQRYGCRRFFLNGSFVSAKELPGDWDGCWEVEGVDIFRLVLESPLLWDDSTGRQAQKRRYGSDIIPVRAAGSAFDRVMLDTFQTDKATDSPKGIIVLDLGERP